MTTFDKYILTYENSKLIKCLKCDVLLYFFQFILIPVEKLFSLKTNENECFANKWPSTSGRKMFCKGSMGKQNEHANLNIRDADVLPQNLTRKYLFDRNPNLYSSNVCFVQPLVAFLVGDWQSRDAFQIRTVSSKIPSDCVSQVHTRCYLFDNGNSHGRLWEQAGADIGNWLKLFQQLLLYMPYIALSGNINANIASCVYLLNQHSFVYHHSVLNLFSHHGNKRFLKTLFQCGNFSLIFQPRFCGWWLP